MRSKALVQVIAAMALSIWTFNNAVAADKPTIWIVLEPKSFGYSADEIFKTVDENSDGKVDEVEFRLHKMELFNQRDTNKDDVLDKKEAGHLTVDAFGTLDKNGDDKISAFEFHQSPIINMSSIDGNKDGSVSRDELRSYLKTIHKKKRP